MGVTRAREARRRVRAALESAINAFAGEDLKAPLLAQATLPLWLGGGGIRVNKDLEAAALLAAGWLAGRAATVSLSLDLGRPLPDEIMLDEALEALGILRDNGILVDLQSMQSTITPDATQELAASPWHADFPVCSCLSAPRDHERCFANAN